MELPAQTVLFHEAIGGRPQTLDALLAVGRSRHVSVAESAVGHQSEDVVSDWTHDVGVVVEAPDVAQAGKYRLVVDRPGVESAHVSIADRLEASDAGNGRPIEERRDLERDALEEQQ